MGDNSIQRLVIQFIMLLRSPPFVGGIGNRGGTLGGGIQDDEERRECPPTPQTAPSFSVMFNLT